MLHPTAVETSPSEILKSALHDRVARNPAYSLRAFARDLGVSHTYLSLVMNNKKFISAHQAAWMADTLKFDAERKDKLVQSTFQRERKTKTLKSFPTFQSLEIEKMRVLSGWYYWAILDLTLTTDFRSSPKWIAKRLGLSEEKVVRALRTLESLGLLTFHNGEYKKAKAHLSVPTKRSHHCMRRLHKEFLNKSVKALSSGKRRDFERRSISGATIAVDPSKIEAANQKIARFRRSLIRFLSEGNCTEVYHLGVQLIPLTKTARDGEVNS